MGKDKKKGDSAESEYIPAEAVFASHLFLGEDYEWQSWGLVIRHLRDFTGVDQEIFGRLIQGYNRGQISRYETEQTEPPIDFWTKLMRMFGLNITWACTGKGLPYIPGFGESDERERFLKWDALISDKENFLKELKGF